jgi:hypothetical protein
MGVTNQTGPATAGPPSVPRCRGHLRREGDSWTWDVRQQCGPTIHEPSGTATSDTTSRAAALEAIRPNYRPPVQP